MAYLQGNTYIDGDLYIEGSLKVKRLSDSSDTNLPYLDTGYSEGSSTPSQPSKLLKFTNDNGGVYASHLMETVANGKVTFDFIKDTSNVIDINNGNLPLTMTSVKSISIDTPSSRITAKNDTNSRLVPLVKKGSKITIDGITYSIPYTQEYTDASGVKYIPWKNPSTDIQNKIKNQPWFIAERFCYSNDLVSV